jgi:subtilisin family serine protease
MPVTINMSLGWHQGAHDGTSPEELALADLTKTPGHIIVAAAGNEGSDYIHLGYTAGGTAKKTLLEVRVDNMTANAALFDSWSPAGAAIEYAVGIAYGAGAEIVETPFYNSEAGSGTVQLDLINGGLNYGTIQFDSQLYPANGKYDTAIYVVPSTSNPDTRFGNSDGLQFYLKVRGAGWFDSWVASENALSRNTSFSTLTGDGLVPGDNDRSIGMPAVNPSIIAVAAYTTKVTWRDIDQVQRTIKGTVGDIAYFSSHGPSGDEKLTGFKPEIAAPGQMIASAMAAGSISLSPGTQIDDTHIMMQGTSMACPHVNGIVALMLQADPKLTVDKVRRILMKTAFKDTFTGTSQNYIWGAGKVRALPAVRMALGIGACDTQDDCKEGRTCTASFCMQSQGGTCYTVTDCAGGLPCTDGICGGGQTDGGQGGDTGGESGGCGCNTVGL